MTIEEEDELTTFAEMYPCLCAQNYPGSTAYHGHDCQTEVVQEFVAQFIAKKRET